MEDYAVRPNSERGKGELPGIRRATLLLWGVSDGRDNCWREFVGPTRTISLLRAIFFRRHHGTMMRMKKSPDAVRPTRLRRGCCEEYHQAQRGARRVPAGLPAHFALAHRQHYAAPPEFESHDAAPRRSRGAWRHQPQSTRPRQRPALVLHLRQQASGSVGKGGRVRDRAGAYNPRDSRRCTGERDSDSCTGDSD